MTDESEIRRLLRDLAATDRAESRRIIAEVEAEISAEEALAQGLPPPSGASTIAIPWLDDIMANAMRRRSIIEPAPAELPNTVDRTG